MKMTKTVVMVGCVVSLLAPTRADSMIDQIQRDNAAAIEQVNRLVETARRNTEAEVIMKAEANEDEEKGGKTEVEAIDSTSAEKIQMVNEFLMHFAFALVLSMICVIVWSRKNDVRAILPRPSIWEGFICAPYCVKFVVFWCLTDGVLNLLLNARQNVRDNAALGIAAVGVLKWLLIVFCILKGHKWPRIFFAIVGSLNVAGVLGKCALAHGSAATLNAASVNMLLNGIVGLVLYWLLSRKDSENWRAMVRPC